MKIRCFKGPCDGERREVPYDQLHHGMIVSITVRRQRTLAEAMVYAGGSVSASEPIIIAQYRAELLRSYDSSWWFLVHESISTEELLDRLFT